jgi:hypothetical protein
MVPTVERGLRPVVFCSMEMAGVRGERFDVTALALGVDGVESERGLAGAAQTGNDREGVARDFDADVLEVMNARPMNTDAVKHGEVRRARANLSLSRAQMCRNKAKGSAHVAHCDCMTRGRERRIGIGARW